MSRYSKNPVLREKQKANSLKVAHSYRRDYTPREIAILMRDYAVVKELVFEHTGVFGMSIKIYNSLPVCDFCNGAVGHEEKNCRRKLESQGIFY